ncbi:HD domain-containing protein [Erysipelotrichaceae bacterium RD49]|nr:HD domain-containing protein [Erysipelotrichaceae bacterium RD49]
MLQTQFERYEKIHDLIVEEFQTIYNQTLRTYAVEHTSMVDAYITLIASSRGLDVELAKVCAVLHDYFKFTRNMPLEHALRGARIARTVLTDSKLFTPEEINLVVHAIEEHSNKDQQSELLDEALKDADVLASWCENPAKPLSPARQIRLDHLKAELHF